MLDNELELAPRLIQPDAGAHEHFLAVTGGERTQRVPLPEHRAAHLGVHVLQRKIPVPRAWPREIGDLGLDPQSPEAALEQHPHFAVEARNTVNVASDARRLGDTLTRDLVKPIVDLNTGPQRRYPTIALILPNDQDDEEFAGILSQLIDRGLRVSQKTVLDRLDLPATAGDEAVLHPIGTAARDDD